MKTRKLLSLLLVMLAVASMLAIPAGAAPNLAVQGINRGVSSMANGFDIYEDQGKSTPWDKKVVVWDAFLANEASDEDAFFTLYNKGQASFLWSVWETTGSNGAKGTEKMPILGVPGVKNPFTFGMNNSNGLDGQLYLTMNAAKAGWYIVELELRFDGIGTFTSNRAYVELRAVVGSLKDAIGNAEAEMAKEDRYTEAYLNNLSMCLDLAYTALYYEYPDQTVQEIVKKLNDAIAGKGIEKVYKLIDWTDDECYSIFYNWINDLPQGLMSFIWQVVDFFSTNPGRVISISLSGIWDVIVALIFSGIWDALVVIFYVIVDIVGVFL